MSKKSGVIISVILFVLLAALMACEVTHPAGGAEMIRTIRH